MKIMVIVRLIPATVRDHLTPLLVRSELTELTIVRRSAIDFPHSKIRQINFAPKPRQHTTQVNYVGRFLDVFRLFGTSFRAARQHQPDAIMTIFFVPKGLYVLTIAKMLGKKTLVKLIGTDYNKDLLERPWRPFWRWVLRQFDAVLIFDDVARQRLIDLGCKAERVFVVPHAIDTERYQRQTDVAQSHDAIYVGHLWPLKQVDRVIEAWKLVVEQNPSCKLAIVGDGSSREAHEKQVRDLGLRNNIDFIGWVEDVPAWLSKAKIFVSVSSQEGVPVSMLEAMCCGLVPIVTAVGGIPSIITNGENGFVLNHPADPQRIAEHVLQLINEPALYETMQAASLAVRNDFSYEAVSAAWEPILYALQGAIS